MEFAGKADAILRARIDFSLNGKDYKKGDVVYFLRDVTMDIDTSTINKSDTTATKTNLAYSFTNITQIRFSIDKIKDSFLSLFYTKKSGSLMSTIERGVVENGVFYLTKKLNSSNPVNINYENIDLNTSQDFSYNEASNSITTTRSIDSFEIIFKYDESNASYDLLEQSFLPFVSLEILSFGMVENVQKPYSLYYEKTKVSVYPVFGINYTGLMNYSMTVSILEGEKRFEVAI